MTSDELIKALQDELALTFNTLLGMVTFVEDVNDLLSENKTDEAKNLIAKFMEGMEFARRALAKMNNNLQ